MGTHNRLARLADGGFVEIIAIDPDATPPACPRWFSLDAPATAARLDAGLVLLTWVVGVDDLDAALERVRAAGIDAGRPVEQQRDDLRWRIALPDDGALVEGGAFPALIEWPPGVDAAARMGDVGLRLDRLGLSHPEPDRLAVALGAIGADALAPVHGGAPGLVATLSVGDRTVTLGG